MGRKVKLHFLRKEIFCQYETSKDLGHSEALFADGLMAVRGEPAEGDLALKTVGK